MKIEFKHIVKKFPGSLPLSDFNATINDGDIVTIIGPSGTGKSTLLRCLVMLEPPTDGEIIIDGLEITNNKANFEKIRRKIGMVFQSFNLFEHLTVIENVMLALTDLKKLSKQEAYDIAIEQLKTVGLVDKALSYPNQLSGGQKQRISIARTLAMDPDIILMDEPTSALDPTMAREVENIIYKLAQTGKTMIVVTHEIRLAKAIGTRVFFMDKGVLYEEGTPDEIFNNPKRERTKAFVNNLKVFKYKFNSGDFSYNKYHNELSAFIESNEIENHAGINLSKLAEDIAKIIIPKFMGENTPVTIIAEYNPENKNVKFLMYYFTKDEAISSDAFQLVRSYSDSADLESIEDDEFNFKISTQL